MDLERFLVAQNPVYLQVLRELNAGRKTTHWMWFIFPQLRGLGQSAMSHLYGIADRDEARRYLAHPLLGPRLVACAQAVLAHDDRSAEAIFGTIDAGKLRSSATLFAADGPAGFTTILDTFFDGRPCLVPARRLHA